MKLYRILPRLLLLTLLAGLFACNQVGRKDDVLAKVGDATILQSEMAFAIANVPPNRRQGPQFEETKRTMFANIIEARIFAEAALKYHGDADGRIGKQLDAFHNRSLTRIYQQYFLYENLGHTNEQLHEFLRTNGKQLQKDTVGLDLQGLRSLLARKLTIQEKQSEYQTWFNENKARFKDRDVVELSMVKSKDSAKVVAMLTMVRAGKSFSELSQPLQQDTILAAEKGKVTLKQGEYHRDLSRLPGANELFFGAQALPVDSLSSVFSLTDNMGQDSTRWFIAFKIEKRVAAPEPDLASLGDRPEIQFTDELRQKMLREAPEKIRQQYEVKIEAIEPPDLKNYWEKNKDSYQTQPAFDVLHIEHSDSALLASATAGLADDATFKAKATEISQNEQTKEKKGSVGVIKASHCLPWGIGMMPALFVELDGKTKGYQTGVMRAPDTQKFHVFRLVESIPPKVKEFERVKKQVAEQLRNSGDFPLDPSTVLASSKGKALVTEKDVIELKKEIPEAQKAMYNREKLLTFLTDWAVFSAEAVKLKLDQSEEFKALSRLQRADFLAGIFRDSVLNKTLGMGKTQLQKAYAANPDSIFGQATFEETKLDVALWLAIPEVAYQREFVLHPERYQGAQDWKSVKAKIFTTIKGQELRGAQERLRHNVIREFPITVLDTAYQYHGGKDVKVLSEQAAKAYQDRNLAEARDLWQKVRDLEPENDSLHAHATLEIARILNEEERFAQASEEYAFFHAVWPNHPDAYKALFMRGFIQAENLKQDSLALQSFQSLLAKFPKSDLADDADWMVRNIKSGGKLAQSLSDSIAKVEENVAPKNATSSQDSGATAVPAAKP